MGIEKYRTKKGVVFWIIDEWLPMPDGTRIRFRQRRIPTREQAQALLAKKRAEAFEDRFFDRRKDSTLTVRDLWKLYEPVSEETKRSHRHDVHRKVHLLLHLGKKTLSSLTVADVGAYRRKRRGEKTRRGHKPKPGTLDREVALLKRMCNYAVEIKLLPVSPLAGADMLNVPNARDMVVAEVQFAKLYAEAESLLKPILLMAYDTGMRKGEILSLQWAQVDLKAGTIELRAQDTKTSQPRLIILTARLVKELEALPRHIRCTNVFVNPKTGNAWNTIYKVFQRACTDVGLEGLWFHDLRRSFVTNARKRGVPESVIMRMTGHKTRNVFERYNIVDDDDLRQAMRMIESGRPVEKEQGEQGEAEAGGAKSA